MSALDITNLFPNQKFHTSGISHKELEDVLRETVAREHPLDPIKDINYTEEGVTIILQSGETIDVEIDWDEFVLG
jgi:hypothetical protein